MKKPQDEERRRNFELRERLDEIVDLARHVSQHRDSLTEEELEAVRTRFEWLAEEIWRSAAFGPLGEPGKSAED